MHLISSHNRRQAYLLLHVAVETQEAEARLLIGRRRAEDRQEERVEELDGLTARDEDDEFLVLRKLNTKTTVY